MELLAQLLGQQRVRHLWFMLLLRIIHVIIISSSMMMMKRVRHLWFMLLLLLRARIIRVIIITVFFVV